MEVSECTEHDTTLAVQMGAICCCEEEEEEEEEDEEEEEEDLTCLPEVVEGLGISPFASVKSSFVS